MALENQEKQKSANKQSEGGVSWFFGADDDIESLDDVAEYQNGFKDGRSDDASDDSVDGRNFDEYESYTTASKHYSTHHRNQSQNIETLTKLDHKSSRQSDKTSSFRRVGNDNKFYDYNRNEDLRSSEDDESFVEPEDEYNKVLHKYGLHRDGGKYRETR